MTTLLLTLTEKTGMNEEVVTETLQILSTYIKEKYPLLEYTVDAILEINPTSES